MAFEGFDAANLQFACRALVEKFAFAFAAWEGKGVAGAFVGNAEIGTGLTPFVAVGFDAASAGAGISDKMGDLVFEGAHDLAFKFGEFGIEFDGPLRPLGEAGGAAEARIPVNLQANGAFVLTEIVEPLTGLLFKIGITSRRRKRDVDRRGDLRSQLRGGWRVLKVEE